VQYEKFKQKELEKEMPKEEKKNEPELKEFILTFYTSLKSENSSAGAVTCQNKPLSRGGVANNVIPQNTKIYLEGYGQVIVNDKGSSKYFSESNRLDVFIEREQGESDTQYLRRVNNYGVQKVQGYVLLPT
jgi:3D (Asp-Asp-Asp) domain-containing protein